MIIYHLSFRSFFGQSKIVFRLDMSDYIVLVKQVPDVSQITDNAFDPESGTLIRLRLASVINELDAQALAFANQMKRDSGDKDGRIIALEYGAADG